MVINSYTPALSTYQQNNWASAKQTEQIASGKKINHAADNPAYMVILQGMLSQSTGNQQAYRNTADTSSLLQVADGAMTDTANIMEDMRSLSVQAANGTLTDEDRSMLQQQMNQLRSQVNSNAANTQFNGITTNDGSLQDFTAQIGANAGQTLSFSLNNMSAEALGINSTINTQAAAADSIDSFSAAQGHLAASQGQVGALTNVLSHTASSLSQADENLQSTMSGMGDTNMAQAISTLNASRIKQYANIYAMKQNIGLQQSTLSVLV